jgi:hypothetical protein
MSYFSSNGQRRHGGQKKEGERRNERKKNHQRHDAGNGKGDAYDDCKARWKGVLHLLPNSVIRLH